MHFNVTNKPMQNNSNVGCIKSEVNRIKPLRKNELFRLNIQTDTKYFTATCEERKDY
ncbi:MAG: hypothetical protein ACI9TV_001006 [Sulfurimonas sp.]|jgi:hypothetical protein|uniref:hypothetical protein n=1 Tax=Sulfurimonas sp. TaxID=2022749 RepID=UPI0039E662AA